MNYLSSAVEYCSQNFLINVFKKLPKKLALSASADLKNPQKSCLYLQEVFYLVSSFPN